MLFKTEKLLLKLYYSNILYHNTYKIQDYDYVIQVHYEMPVFLLSSYFMFSSTRSRTLILKLLSFTKYSVQYKNTLETIYFISDEREHNIKMFNKMFINAPVNYYYIENSILHMLYNKSEIVLDDMVYYFKNVFSYNHSHTRSENYITIFNRIVEFYENIHDTTKLTEIVNYLKR